MKWLWKNIIPLLTLGAFLVSIWTLCVNNKANDLAERNLQIAINPQINVYLQYVVNNTSSIFTPYLIGIENNGISQIVNLSGNYVVLNMNLVTNRHNVKTG